MDTLTRDQIQDELDAIMLKLKDMAGILQEPEDRKILNRMYELIDLLKNKTYHDELDGSVETSNF